MTPEELEAIKKRLANGYDADAINALISEVERAWAEILELRSEIKILHDVLAPADLLIGELSDEIERLKKEAKEIAEFDTYFEGT